MPRTGSKSFRIFLRRVPSFLGFLFYPMVFGLSVASSQAQANQESHSSGAWKKINVTDAVCGNGEPYAYFIREGRPDKLTLEFKGGGACWDSLSCFGPVPLTQLWLQTPVSGDGINSQNPEESSLFDSTYVTFPYCTGDIHAGNHIASYAGRKVYHMGAQNIFLSLTDLQAKEVFSQVTEVNVVGGSAGALGVLLHTHQIEGLIEKENVQPELVKRSALVDSPGLHFGDTFWDKFPDAYFDDLAAAMNAAGVQLDRSSGNISPQMKNFCEAHSNWKIGFLQSTRDRIMSLLFGNIGQVAHQRLVLGDTGISEIGRKRYGRCAVWIHDSARHTFVFDKASGNDRTRDVTAADFAAAILGNLETGSTLP